MSIRELSPQEASEKLQQTDQYQLIDVREENEYADVHAEGAVNIPLSQLTERYSEIPQDRDTILICRSGVRSMQAAEFLAQHGYDESRLHNLQGGTNDWVAQDLPHVQPASDLPTTEQVLEALKIVKDPEIPVNVVDLGLIYEVEINPTGQVEITMTLTSVGCPVQDLIRADAEMAVGRLDGVSDVNVEFVWTPPWNMEMMTEDGKRQMRMFGFNV